MLLSIFYIISVIIIYSGVMLFPKNGRKCSAAVWSVVSLILMFVFHTMYGIVAGNIMKLPVNLISMGICNIITGAVFHAYIIKSRKRQEYYADVTGWIMLAGLLVCTLIIGMLRFDVTFNMFRYATSDSSVHLNRVLKIVNNQRLTDNRFYLYLIEAMVINVFSPVVNPGNYYRIFILCDLFMWFLSGAVFFALIRKYMSDKKLTVYGIIFILMYYFAYPLNNLIYGFNYLGAAVTLAAFIMFAARCFQDGMMQRWFSVMCMCLGNIAVTLCYTQFMPATLAASVLFTGAVVLSEKKNVNYRRLALIAVLCVILGAAGMYYIISTGFGSLDVLLESLRGEGPVYRDLWSNVFFYIIFIVMYAKYCIRHKKLHEGYFFLIPLVCYAGLFFVFVVNEMAAAYYFYKFHYLLWLFILYAAFAGLFYSIQKYSEIYRVYTVIAGVILVIALTGVEDRLSSANVWWVSQAKSEAYFDIYRWNEKSLQQNRTDITNDMQAMYYVVSQLVEDEDTVVAYLGNYEDYWIKYYYNLTCQSDNYEYFLANMDAFADDDTSVAELMETYVFDVFDSAKYIMVENESEIYWRGIGYYNNLEKIYSNDYGTVYSTGR